MIKSYRTISSFLNEELKSLEDFELENSLLLGLIMNASNDQLTDGFNIIKSYSSNSTEAIGVVWGSNIILGKIHSNQSNGLDEISDFCFQNDIILPGVIGPTSLAQHFGKHYASSVKKKAITNFEQFIFRCDQLKEYRKCKGRFRLAKIEDKKLLQDWIYLFCQEAMNRDDRKGSEKIFQNKFDKNELFVWVCNERVVSMAAFARPTNLGVSINYVYTPFDQRGHGYATNVVAELSQKMLDEGYEFCTLFTDQSNPTSNKIYEEIGYKKQGTFEEIIFV